MTIEDPAQLDVINHVIHDCWFTLDRIELSAGSVLEIPFEREQPEHGTVKRKLLFVKRVSVPVAELMLRIHHVERYQIDDEAKVGRYDFNIIRYSPQTQELVIATGVPLRFTVNVRQLGVEVADSGKVIAHRTRVTL